MSEQLDKQYHEVMAGQRLTERQRNEAHEHAIQGSFQAIPESGRWSLNEWQYDGTPYVKFSCAPCKQIWTTSALELEVRHCGRVSTMPEELSQRLEALQIKKGLRQTRSFIDKIFGRAAEPTPNMKAF